MSFLGALFSPRERKVADATNLTWSAILGLDARSKTGLSVSQSTALRVSTVFACCKVLCEDVGKLPLKVMRETAGHKKEIARKHPLHKVLSKRPNPWQTSMEWRMTTLLHALVGGGGYSYINRSNDQTVVELIPMLPGSVCPKQTADWSLYYEWTGPDGRMLRLPREDVHALRGLSWDGYRPLDTIQQGKEAIGLAMAAEETQARLHGQGARPGGIVSTPSKLGKQEVDNIKATFAEGYTGVDNAFKTLLLDNGLKFEPWAMNGVDGQHIETRKHQVEEICRFFRVFPSMIGASDKASTYASAESFFGAHVSHSLMPWGVLWKEALERDLLTEEEQNQGYFVKFFYEGLLRGSAEQRSAFYESAITRGCWMSRNEARRLEDLDPVPGLDEMLSPLNMRDGSDPKPGAGGGNPPPEGDPDEDPDAPEPPAADDE